MPPLLNRIRNRINWRMPLENRIVVAVLILLGTIGLGTVGYWVLTDGQAPLLDRFYMTVITITTIGFHEIIDLSGNPRGRLFTVGLALVGISTLTYLLSNAAAYIIEHQISHTFAERRIKRRVNRMREHYIICGGGRVGRRIAQELHQGGKSFVLVERDVHQLQRVQKLVPNLNYLHEDASQDDVLDMAGIDRATGVFAATGDENDNLAIALTSKYLNPKVRVVARTNREEVVQKLMKAGADEVVSSVDMGAVEMVNRMVLSHPGARLTSVRTLDRQAVYPVELTLGPQWEGQTVAQLEAVLHPMPDVILVALQDPTQDGGGTGWVFNPRPETALHPGLLVMMLTAQPTQPKLEALCAGVG